MVGSSPEPGTSRLPSWVTSGCHSIYWCDPQEGAGELSNPVHFPVPTWEVRGGCPMTCDFIPNSSTGLGFTRYPAQIPALLFLLCCFSPACGFFCGRPKPHSHRSVSIFFFACCLPGILVFCNSKDTGSWNSKAFLLKTLFLVLSVEGLFRTSKVKQQLFPSLDRR